MSRPNPKATTTGTENRDRLVIFPSRLGWIAMVGSGRILKRVTFAHPSRDAAMAALGGEVIRNATGGRWNDRLVQRLRAYAEGHRDEFLDVRIDLSGLSDFRRRVTEHCRRIPYGRTLTYGELAAEAGSPRAARAVGQCMAANRLPLIVPCHRVVLSTGGVGPFSAPGGRRTKERLLALEGAYNARRKRRFCRTNVAFWVGFRHNEGIEGR